MFQLSLTPDLPYKYNNLLGHSKICHQICLASQCRKGSPTLKGETNSAADSAVYK